MTTNVTQMKVLEKPTQPSSPAVTKPEPHSLTAVKQLREKRSSLALSVDEEVTLKKVAGIRKENPVKLKARWPDSRLPKQVRHPNNGQVNMLFVQSHSRVNQGNQNFGMPTLARHNT